MKKTLLDRAAMAFLGVLAGTLYGVCLAVFVAAATEQWHASIVSWSAGVFGVIGFFYENVLLEGVLMLLHFLYGFLMSDTWGRPPSREFGQSPHLHVFMLIGFGTGVVFAGWWWS